MPHNGLFLFFVSLNKSRRWTQSTNQPLRNEGQFRYDQLAFETMILVTLAVLF